MSNSKGTRTERKLVERPLTPAVGLLREQLTQLGEACRREGEADVADVLEHLEWALLPSVGREALLVDLRREVARVFREHLGEASKSGGPMCRREVLYRTLVKGLLPGSALAREGFNGFVGSALKAIHQLDERDGVDATVAAGATSRRPVSVTI